MRKMVTGPIYLTKKTEKAGREKEHREHGRHSDKKHEDRDGEMENKKEVTRETLPGLVIINLTTDKGAVSVDY